MTRPLSPSTPRTAHDLLETAIQQWIDEHPAQHHDDAPTTAKAILVDVERIYDRLAGR